MQEIHHPLVILLGGHLDRGWQLAGIRRGRRIIGPARSRRDQ
jgi:hypothetical protein